MQIEFFLTFQPDFIRSAATLAVREGYLLSLSVVEGAAQIAGPAITWGSIETATILKVRLEISEAVYGGKTSIVHWQAENGGFSFLPYLLAKEKNIAIPDLGVVISQTRKAAEAGARRTPDFSQTPTGRGITWDYWASRNIDQEPVPTLLGVSRDQRFFVVDYATDRITASLDLLTTSLQYSIGHIAGADTHTRRSLERGYLPILHARQQVGDLVVEDTAFVTFADQPLTEANLVGTSLPLSHLGSYGGTFPGDGRARALEESATRIAEGELVLFLRTRVTNTGRIPLLASTPLPRPFLINQAPVVTPETGGSVKEFGGGSTLDERGVYWSDDRPLSLHYVDGQIANSAQPGTLLSAGETFTVDSILAHDVKGLSPATQQASIAWDEKFAEAVAFWEAKLAPAAQIVVPEERLNHLWKAGLCHLELVTLGETSQGALLPKVGIYTAIGSESLPMIEFYHSVGLADTARRCTESFFEFQKETGRINMYLYYDIETGGGLWVAGLHYAYTQDQAWVRRYADQLKQAADYLLSERQFIAGPGYGLAKGTCADPVEATTSFMLNAYNVAGVRSVAEMLRAVSDPDATRFEAAAQDYASCLRKAIALSLAQGPVLPVAEGRWVPTCAPWVEGTGPQALGLQGERGFTHRTNFAHDALLGPLSAVYTGSIGFTELAAQWLLEVNHAQYNRAAVTESQPYYSRHPELHLMRGERENFLNAFYSALAGLADRETLSFWEHFYHVSIHKTHEEGWALMQLRRMLWLECGRELRLLAGIPASWLADEPGISIAGAASYFGGFDFSLTRLEDGGALELNWQPRLHTMPERLRIHLPGLAVIASADERLLVADEWLEILLPSRAWHGQVAVQPIASSPR